MVQDTAGTLLRLAAFATDPAGGNPAGVRPSRLTVSIVAGEAGVRVSGSAVPI